MPNVPPSCRVPTQRTTHLLHSGRAAICNIGFALSYWLLPDSYRFYRIQKRLFNVLLGANTPILKVPCYESDGVVIQGFRHSGNTFVISNVAVDDQRRLPQAWHRIWTVKQAVTKGLPIVVLIRQPARVAESAVYRTAKNAVYPYTSYFIFPWAVLLAWIGYYRWVSRLRGAITIVPLDLVAGDYPAFRDMIADKMGVRMNETPDWSNLNRYPGDRWDLKLSPLSQLLLRKAEALYDMLVEPGTRADGGLSARH